MNANRRRSISKVIEKLEQMDALKAELIEMIEEIKNDEEEAYENLPESLQETDRGEAMQEAIDNLDNAQGDLDLIDIEAIIDYLAEAQA